MRHSTFLSGLTAGAAIVGVVWWLWPARRHEERVPDAGSGVLRTRAVLGRVDAAARRTEDASSPSRSSRRRTGSEAAVAPPASTDHAPFPDGEAWLRVGEGYVFGETSARRRGDGGDGGDIVCLDIAGEAVLDCTHGVATADVPLGAVGLPPTAAYALDRVADAPARLEAGRVRLSASSSARAPGVALVGAANGRTYKLAVVEITGDADVLSRVVQIRYAEVPSKEGGGSLAVPHTTAAGDAPTLALLNEIVAAGAALPGDSFSRFLEGSYERLPAPPAQLVLSESKYLVLDDPLTTSVEFRGSSGLVAARGIAVPGRVRVRSYAGVAVRGDMEGEIDIDSYAYVHVSGRLTGKLRVRSYATVVIDGDLVGEVESSSYVTFLLRGRLLGKLDIRSGGSKFWFQEYMARGTAEALGGKGNELHLRVSDWANGVYEDVPGWSSVRVGEDAWTLIAK